MEITDVRARKVESNGRLIGIASVTFNDGFVVHDIKIIKGDEDNFIAMPSKRQSDGTYKDIAHPINAETREMIQIAVLNAFNELDD